MKTRAALRQLGISFEPLFSTGRLYIHRVYIHTHRTAAASADFRQQIRRENDEINLRQCSWEPERNDARCWDLERSAEKITDNYDH